MNEKSDAGDDQQHDQRKLIKDNIEVDVEGAGINPIAQGLDVWQGVRLKSQSRCIQHDQQRTQRRKQRDRCDDCLRQPPPQQPIEQKACKGQQRDQPEMEIFVHSFIRSMRSTASVARARNTAIMMASPTAASAAATIITKKTKSVPSPGATGGRRSQRKD